MIVLAVEFESFPERRWEADSQSGPALDELWLEDRSRKVSERGGTSIEKSDRTVFIEQLLAVVSILEKIFPNPRYGLLPRGLMYPRTPTRPVELLDCNR